MVRKQAKSSAAHFVGTLEDYQRSLGQPRRLKALRNGVFRGGRDFLIYGAVGALVIFGSAIAPLLARGFAEVGYLGYLKFAPIKVVAWIDHEHATWLWRIRHAGCSEYEARTAIEKEFTGRVDTLLYPVFLRCVEATRDTKL